MLLPDQPSSWVGILKQRYIGTDQTEIAVGIAQLRDVLSLIRRQVIMLTVHWYAVAFSVLAYYENWNARL